MYKQLKRLILLFFMLFVLSSTLEAQTVISFKRVPISDSDYKDDPELGHRLPSRNVMGYIDWENKSFILPNDISESVLSYELWTDETCIIQSSDSDDIVYLLSNLANYNITIVITTLDYTLIGVYTPEN